ncbi:MAG: GTPase, partial [Leptolyngbyaceae bacterium]|nr:GTPase [Leptolyngbyaceae bacterium]
MSEPIDTNHRSLTSQLDTEGNADGEQPQQNSPEQESPQQESPEQAPALASSSALKPSPDSKSSDSKASDSKPFDSSELQAKLSESFNESLSALSSWRSEASGFWNKATSSVREQLSFQSVSRWFRVSDEEVAEILDAVRTKLPTTEVILIGKPQSGKSSIVRGITGVSADIVGQGFRPHTQHTQQYAYPSEDLPLIIFTDTVGLGDINQDTDQLIDDLLTDLDEETSRARIFILTVKINDFASDTLRHIIRQLRKQNPDIPCLLAVTCLHELYPPDLENHPDYPPELATLQRAFDEIRRGFEKVSDDAVMIDFTLEEDEFDPVFYGLDALRDAIAQRLPEAESNAIYRLLDEQTDASKQLGTLYRDVGRRYIATFSTMAATLAAVPLPFATMPVLTALQVSMIGVLGNLYGQVLSPSQAGGVASAIAGGFVAQAVGRELIKFIPGFGSVIAAS